MQVNFSRARGEQAAEDGTLGKILKQRMIEFRHYRETLNAEEIKWVTFCAHFGSLRGVFDGDGEYGCEYGDTEP